MSVPSYLGHYPPVLAKSPNSASSTVNRLKSSPKVGVRSSSSSQTGESCGGGEYESNSADIEDAWEVPLPLVIELRGDSIPQWLKVVIIGGSFRVTFMRWSVRVLSFEGAWF